MPNHIVIISCGKSKNNGSDCLAKDAYIGQSFLLKRKYAELSRLPWFILSGKYGLLKPDTEINPNYDMTISTKGDITKLTSVIRKQIPDFLEYSVADEVIFLGPEAYVIALKIAFGEKTTTKINHITKGLNQGKSQKIIRNLIDQFDKKTILVSA
jgi:hypothetical protein